MNSFQSPMSEIQVTRTVQAVDWFLRVGAEDVSERELTEWIEWCGDVDNLHEFQHVRNTWAGFDQLRPQATALLDALLCEPAVLEESVSLARATDGRRRWAPITLAASLIAIAIAGAWYAYDAGLFIRNQQLVVGRDRERSAVLPDGSTLMLAPKTNIAVNFGGAVRNLDLSHGQAYFKVRPNKAKPFVVTADGVKVTAVGTAFDVRSELNRVVVTVQEGVVEVTPASDVDAMSPERWRVSAGNQLAYNESPRSAQIRAVDPDRAMAWRDGRLEYYGEPLSSVVADVSRYSNRPIELGDPQLAQLTFTGTVFTESVDDWLSAIQTTFPIRAVITDDHRVLLLRR
jgi:transmembrane sensor